jgi:hypothetical protein
LENCAAQDSSKSSPGIPDTLGLPACRAGGCRGKRCCSAVQSRAAQYAGTVGRFRSAGIKNETPWAMGRDMRAGVRTACNRTVGVCESGEHGERGSGKHELKPGRAQTNSPGSRVGVGKSALRNRLVAGPEMRYRPETARRGRRSALPESSEQSERRQQDHDQQRWQPLG